MSHSYDPDLTDLDGYVVSLERQLAQRGDGTYTHQVLTRELRRAGQWAQWRKIGRHEVVRERWVEGQLWSATCVCSLIVDVGGVPDWRWLFDRAAGHKDLVG